MLVLLIVNPEMYHTLTPRDIHRPSWINPEISQTLTLWDIYNTKWQNHEISYSLTKIWPLWLYWLYQLYWLYWQYWLYCLCWLWKISLTSVNDRTTSVNDHHHDLKDASASKKPHLEIKAEKILILAKKFIESKVTLEQYHWLPKYLVPIDCRHFWSGPPFLCRSPSSIVPNIEPELTKQIGPIQIKCQIAQNWPNAPFIRGMNFNSLTDCISK